MNLKEAKEKYIELGAAIENLQQNTERNILSLLYSALGQYLTNELEHGWSSAESPSTNYDETFGDDKLCNCGHPYYRHFDSYDENRHVGCKYCECFDWEPLDESRLPNIMEFSKLAPLDMFTRFGNSRYSLHMSYIKIEDRVVFDKNVNSIEIDPTTNEHTYTMIPDCIKVEKTGVHKK